jgi:hypothetical protein
MTPEALGKAMALQGQGGAQPGGTLAGYEIEAKGEEGGEHVYHIALKASDGQAANVMTRWKEVDGAWKVADIGMIQ